MTATSRWALVLAIGATGTAGTLSVLTGLQRGGTLPEQFVWVAIGIVLVVSAHLLPALIRDAPIVARGTGGVLWLACMAAACYGHAEFFLLAQRHAGELRASTVTTVPASMASRSLTVVMSERATVTAQLAAVDAKRCTGDCRTLDSRRVTLAAKLDALNAEADDIRRNEAAHDRVAAQRDALLADPVTTRLAALLGTTTARVDLLSGLAFAAVLEGVACLLWTVALRQSSLPAPAVADAVAPATKTAGTVAATEAPGVMAEVTTVPASHGDTTGSHAAGNDPLTPLPLPGVAGDDVTRLARDISAGRLRPTVAGIRQHLGCSQAKASALRRVVLTLS